MYKIIFISTILVFSCLGCQKDPNPPINFPVDLPNCRLLGSSQKGEFRSYTYEYDASGRLIKQIEKWNGVDRLWYVLNYDGDKLISREHWSEYPNSPIEMVRLDSLVYNDIGQIIEKRELLPNDNFSTHLIYFYEYDSNELPIKSRTFYPTNNEFWSSHKYIWEDGNITKKEDYEGEFGQLEHEWFYEHGDALNYQLILGLIPEHPEYRTTNMVKSSMAKDYTGLLDLICNPCKTNYKVNDEGLPTSIHYEWDEHPILLEWECE